MDRLFFDANVLFSAAYREDSGLLQFWQLPGVELATSAFAASEAERNLISDATAAATVESLDKDTRA